MRRIQSGLGRIQLGLGRIQSDWGRIQLGLRVKNSIGAVDIFSGMGVLRNPMRVLKRVNGGIEKIRRGYCVGSMQALRALKTVNGGVGEGQWGHWSGSMVVLRRVNAGIERWGLNGCIEKDQWGHWSGSMRVFKRVNGGVGQGQWGYGEGSGQTGPWLWVRQRGVAVGQTGGCLTGL